MTTKFTCRGGESADCTSAARCHHHGLHRLRPNIVIGGVAELVERESPGGCLRIGDVWIGVQYLRDRRVMTSFDSDTLAQDKEITRKIYRRFEGKLALHFLMIAGGEIAVRNEAQLGAGPRLR